MERVKSVPPMPHTSIVMPKVQLSMIDYLQIDVVQGLAKGEKVEEHCSIILKIGYSPFRGKRKIAIL
jgi:hypothetical protein